MLEFSLAILGRLLIGSILIAVVLTRSARAGPHRLWSSAVFYSFLAALLQSTSQIGIPVLGAGCFGFSLQFWAVALASGACALTIQALRASHMSVRWQLGAGAIAAEAALMSGVGLW